MSQIFLLISRAFGCVTLTLLLAAALAVPSQKAWADDLSNCACAPNDFNCIIQNCGGFFTSSCPQADVNGCPLNNDNHGGCASLACRAGKKICDCVWTSTSESDPTKGTCTCPGN